ncbi:MAG: hypothetical protein B7Z47_03605 [Chthoniobacter sp. 12-60-6]|nr:MAG: hypothetical protein B7Z47_03605 [Chthoniobacter sp. 12-60-6]
MNKDEQPFPSTSSIARLVHHIQSEWHGLSRGLRQVTQAVTDVKLGVEGTQGCPIYVSRSEDLPRVQRIFEKSVPPNQLSTLRLKVLPSDPARIDEHGLLFLMAGTATS